MKFTKYLVFTFIFIGSTFAHAKDNFNFTGQVNIGNSVNLCDEVSEQIQCALEKLNIQINSSGCELNEQIFMPNTLKINIVGESADYSSKDFSLSSDNISIEEFTFLKERWKFYNILFKYKDKVLATVHYNWDISSLVEQTKR